ncbi:multicomponent Na+:H+ antiporter subunit E [Rhizobium sp. RU20A]|uniref:Na+/H+ antiporter subunit E n=1 Tax=Rhizobium sp. RU20A TaxID=1907412 RepID=UPI0009555C36|nr:Na+/H+ antiporter subunit E [Rhizobium sp. RU20A]SIR16669.1 multicomponent Na+:H+ antiporter subunit E [Rhizobium sp. RU20A]
MKRVGLLAIMILCWAAVSGSFSIPNLLLGAIVSLACFWLVRDRLAMERLPIRPIALTVLFLLFLKELALSVMAVVRTVLKRDMALKPGIFAYETNLTRDFEVTLLANMITLTPGTLSVDVAEGRKGEKAKGGETTKPTGRILYVHALDCADPAALRRGIAEGFERRIREAFA